MAIITDAGLALKAQLQANEQTLVIDKFIFANIDGLDPSQEPPGTETLPAAEDIVHEAAVSKAGYSGVDTVIYNCMLSSAVGDFSFNWIGLYCTEHSVLFAIAYNPLQEKRATAGFQMGNTLSKNFAIQFLNATDLTGVTIEAESWQIDFNARLKGIDERERLSNFDYYGNKYFFGDAFKVYDNSGYQLTAGIAYIDGIRIKLDADQAIGDPGDLPTKIYLDACLAGDYSGVEAAWTVQISADALADYVDEANQQHYLEQIATINADGSITDERGNDVVGGLVNATNEHDHDDDYAALDHNHDGDYAALDHEHDEYLKLTTASSTIYVAADGSDTTGDGSSGSPFATIGKALSSIAESFMVDDTDITISVADGTYTVTSPIIINHPFGERIKIIGNETTPANVIFNCTGTAFQFGAGAHLQYLNGFKLVGDGTGCGVNIPKRGFCFIGPNMVIDNFNSGVSIAEWSLAYVQADIMNCDWMGVEVANHSVATISNSTISANANGVQSAANSHIVINGSVTIQNNTGFGVRAIYNSQTAGYTPTVSGNGTDYSPAVSATDSPSWGNDCSFNTNY